MSNSTRPQPSQRIKYSFLKILTGSDLSMRRLALMECRSVQAGPAVWLTGCGHGDEVGGIVVIQEVFKRLRKSPLRAGTLHAFPLMNPLGFETASRHIGFSKEDLNRAFPGNPSGSMAERIANLIFTTIMENRPTLVLDLHNDWTKSIPYVLVDPCPSAKWREVHERTRQFAHQMGFVVISEQNTPSNLAELKRTLTGSLLVEGIAAATVELGEAYVVNERNVEDGVVSIWNVLAQLGMVDPLPQKLNFRMPDGLAGKVLAYTHQPAASTSGIVRFLVRPGQLVKKGQKTAKIYNVFGKLQETILAEKDGIVLGYADSSVAQPGVSVVACGVL